MKMILGLALTFIGAYWLHELTQNTLFVIPLAMVQIGQAVISRA